MYLIQHNILFRLFQWKALLNCWTTLMPVSLLLYLVERFPMIIKHGSGCKRYVFLLHVKVRVTLTLYDCACCMCIRTQVCDILGILYSRESTWDSCGQYCTNAATARGIDVWNPRCNDARSFSSVKETTIKARARNIWRNYLILVT